MRSWLLYDASSKTAKAKVDKDLVKKAVPLLEKLHGLMPTLCFKRTTVSSCMELLCATYKNYNMDASEVPGWVMLMTRRFMNLCRSVSQSSNAAWARDVLPWIEPLTVPTTKASTSRRNVQEGGGDQPDAGSSTSYFYGWNAELLQAWRQVVGTNLREHSQRMEIPEGAADDDHPVAVWTCGFRRQIMNVTCAELNAMGRPRAVDRHELPVFFDGSHCRTHHRILCK